MTTGEPGTRRIALVTGANRGIGFEVCRQLAARGMTVILGARDPATADSTARTLAEDGLDGRPLSLDVTDEESVARAAGRLESEFGVLDILVDNATAYVDWSETAATADIDAARTVFETNLFGTWRTCKAFLPLLRRSAHGRIVNVSSGAGSHGEPQFGLATSGAAASRYRGECFSDERRLIPWPNVC